ECANQNVRDHPAVSAEPCPARSENAKGVGLIDVEVSVVFIAEGAQASQVGRVAVHAVVGLDEYPSGSSSGAAGQLPCDGVGVAVVDDGYGCSRQAAPIDERRVIEPAGYDEVVAPAQVGDRANVCRVAAGEEQCGGPGNPLRQEVFQGQVVGMRAVDQSRSSRSEARLGWCFT